jgi:hypothetical protein
VLAGEADPSDLKSNDSGGGSDPSENGTIDCSIPDNRDDTGCDKGDTNDNGSGPPPPLPAQPAEPAQPSTTRTTSVSGSDTDTGRVPRGGVSTGAGGTARRVFRAAVLASTAR